MLGIGRKLKCKEERRDFDNEKSEGIMCRIKEEKIGNKGIYRYRDTFCSYLYREEECPNYNKNKWNKYQKVALIMALITIFVVIITLVFFPESTISGVISILFIGATSLYWCGYLMVWGWGEGPIE